MDLIRAGRSILLSEPPKPHLWFILTDPDRSTDKVVAVMLTTTRTHTDKTVLLQPGDHPFVRHETSVAFSSARFLGVQAIRKLAESGRCHLREDLSPDLLKRVRQGLIDSPFTVNAIRDYCRKAFKG